MKLVMVTISLMILVVFSEVRTAVATERSLGPWKHRRRGWSGSGPLLWSRSSPSRPGRGCDVKKWLVQLVGVYWG